MCIIPGDKIAAAMHDDMQRVDMLSAAERGINAFFAPHMARAEAQANMIARAARLCREAEDEDEPWSTQP